MSGRRVEGVAVHFHRRELMGRWSCAFGLGLLFVAPLGIADRGAMAATALGQRPPGQAPAPKPQPRPHGTRVTIDPAAIEIDDGDTFMVREAGGTAEMVRILGIDSPETRHLEHDLPFAQSFGEEARAFAIGVFAVATRVELLRAATVDPYGRTLAYVFVNGSNYSLLIIRARLAQETITQYGDNGFPAEAAAVSSAARQAGPLPFEPPSQFRLRMRDVTCWMKERGIYPQR